MTGNKDKPADLNNTLMYPFVPINVTNATGGQYVLVPVTSYFGKRYKGCVIWSDLGDGSYRCCQVNSRGPIPGACWTAEGNVFLSLCDYDPEGAAMEEHFRRHMRRLKGEI